MPPLHSSSVYGLSSAELCWKGTVLFREKSQNKGTKTCWEEHVLAQILSVVTYVNCISGICFLMCFLKYLFPLHLPFFSSEVFPFVFIISIYNFEYLLSSS